MKFCEKCGKEIMEEAKFCNGCGAAVEVAPIETTPVVDKMGILQIKRKRSLTGSDAFRAYKIFIDGKEVDDIKSGETKNIKLTQGTHTLQLKIDWCSSKEVGFSVGDNTITEAECYPTGKGAFSMISAVANKDNYITVKIS